MNTALKRLITDLAGIEKRTPAQMTDILKGWEVYFRHYQIPTWEQEREFYLFLNSQEEFSLVAPEVEVNQWQP